MFELSGQLTFQTVPRFQEHIGTVLQGDPQPVTIDMQGISLADSAGLALMIEWLQRARAAQREIVFANIPEQVRQLIRVNGLTQVFRIKNGQD
ncbi:STAS domain-containing protein [Sulfuricaulis limicola]|uniref:STAS domain-containing protein n=1 Tax=Sulfuricaulis limicola TaxID=1620215 RepID=UPI001553EA63|nr:STAS domain-containing protein [Sulfuricaulis limicola]